MGINVFPTPTTASSIPTGWTAGVAGTFLLSNTLTTGTYLIKTDSTQSMTMTLVDSVGHNFTGTIRGGSGFISVPNDVNQIKVPSGMTYPFGIEITPISVIQLAAPVSASLSLGAAGVMTGTWTAPAGAVSAHLLTTTGAIVDFTSATSGATATITESNTTPNALNNFVIAFKNSSGAWGIGATVPYTMPATPYPYNVEYLVVGAGGAAGGVSYSRSGGGGGAVKTSTTLSNALLGSSFTINVAPTTLAGTSGASSTLTYGSTTITATGGAGGVAANNNGANGSSGSGGFSQGSATAIYSGGIGLDGGNGGNTPSPNTTYESQGAGGGAGGSASGWNSGNGVASSITGTSTYYAGGGAGGQYTSAGTVGLGGTARGTAATSNTGAGAGAGGNFGGTGDKTGGSGVAILAYPTTGAALTTIPGTLTYTVDTTTRAGYRVYKFTAGSGTVTI